MAIAARQSASDCQPGDGTTHVTGGAHRAGPVMYDSAPDLPLAGLRPTDMQRSFRGQMKSGSRFLGRLGLFLCASLVCPALLGPVEAMAQQPQRQAEPDGNPAAKRPRRTDRIFVKDIEGLWINQRYVDALQNARDPLAASRKAPPIVIKIQKDGHGYAVARTDFDRAVLLRVIDLQPEEKPGTFRLVMAEDDMRPVSEAEVTRMSFRGQKAETGRFEKLSIAEPTFGRKKMQDYIHLEEGLAPFVNRMVIEGAYTDAGGAAYRFSKEGEAELPEGKFKYELRLSPKGADCSVVEIPDDGGGPPRKRLGLRRKGDQLELLEVDARKPENLRCSTKPLAVLTPQSP